MSLTRNVLLMSAGTMTSRILGLVRGIMLAQVIGVFGLTADVFQVANTLPNQFYALVGGGVLNGILVPQIVKARTQADQGEAFTNRIITLAVTFLLVSTLILTLLAPWLVSLFSDDFPPDAQRLATIFAAICLPQVFFYGLYTLLGQILNAHGRFLPYLWAPVLANLVAIAGLVWFKVAGYPLQAPVSQWSTPMILTLAGSATLSILVQAVCLVIPLRRIGFRFRPVWGIRGVGLATTSRIALWTMAGVAVSQAGFAVTSTALTRAANFGTETGAAVPSRGTFDYAFLLFMLPHSLITVSLVTALFTRMAGSVSDGDADGVRRDYRSAILTVAPRLIPASALIATLAPVVTGTLYVGNTLAETRVIAVMVTWMVLGVLPYGWLYLNDRTFFVHDDGKTPFLIQCLVTGTAVSFAVAALLGPPERIGVLVAIGQTTAYVIGALAGMALLRHRLGRLGIAHLLSTCARIAVPAGVYAVLLAWVVGRLLPGLGETRGMAAMLSGGLVLTLAGVAQLALTWFSAHLLGVREIGDAAASIAARVRRRGATGA